MLMKVLHKSSVLINLTSAVSRHVELLGLLIELDVLFMLDLVEDEGKFLLDVANGNLVVCLPCLIQPRMMLQLRY